MLKENFVETIRASLAAHWDLPALSDFDGDSDTYGRVADRIVWLHHVFKKCRIKRGDKIALFGRNGKNWGIVYFATITWGAVIVPILPDFHPDDVSHIVNHSDSVLLFANESLFEKLDPERMPGLAGVIALEGFRALSLRRRGLGETLERADFEYLKPWRGRLDAKGLVFPKIANKELASIVYTSGTTGFSKGVMLPYNSLMGNVKFARENLPVGPGDPILSFLPVAHCYGCAFDFLYPFAVGAHITFLGRIPSPRVLLEAMQRVRPRLIMSVPLILEKVYKNRIMKKLDKTAVRLLRRIPVMEKAILAKVKKQLTEAFGGNFIQIVIGGAALNREVEQFFRRIGIPITVGYGMTECGPLISYAAWDETKPGSIGRALPGLMEVMIDSPDPANTVGEILVRGENLMDGYYKNRKDTKEAIDRKGWLHTGDLGVMDAEGFLYIRGRSKTMLLGPSGQNIYPEEIESRLNSLPLVQESLVVERDGRFLALVYPDMEQVDRQGLGEDALVRLMEKNRRTLNSLIPSYAQIARIELHPEEFEKTPKKSIKRFLYT